MLKIENIKKGKFTTIFGLLFLIADFVYFIYPFFKNDFETSIAMVVIGATIGGGFLLMPDELIKNFLTRKP